MEEVFLPIIHSCCDCHISNNKTCTSTIHFQHLRVSFLHPRTFNLFERLLNTYCIDNCLQQLNRVLTRHPYKSSKINKCSQLVYTSYDYTLGFSQLGYDTQGMLSYQRLSKSNSQTQHSTFYPIALLCCSGTANVFHYHIKDMFLCHIHIQLQSTWRKTIFRNNIHSPSCCTNGSHCFCQ